jgi:hypothetical protein
MGFKRTDRVAAAQDRGQVVRLVYVVQQNGEIGLALGKH